MSRVVVTGAGGFVGRAVCRSLAAAGHDVIGTTRGSAQSTDPQVEMLTVAEQESSDAWQPVLAGVDHIVHLAARVHVMRETAEDPLEAFRAANVLTTRALARAASHAGVRRLVFLSTIKVLGEATAGRPFRHGDPAAPDDPYSVSKSEAEDALRSTLTGGATRFVILRPPMIYGPGVGGNLRRVFSLVQRGYPVPLASVRNARTMLALDNLADVIELAMEHPDAAGKTLLVADDEAVSTPRLFRIVARSMGRPVRLFPLPVSLLRAAARLSGKTTEIDRLCGDLEVDIEYTRQQLGWTPRVSPAEGLAAAVAHFLRQQGDGDD